MKRHFFLEKTNTIFSGSKVNSGFNPVLSLTYGNGVSRALLKIDTDKIKKCISDGYLSENSKHILVMKNASSVIGDEFKRNKRNIGQVSAERASSFDLILFRLPFDFDQGAGSSLSFDFWYDVKTSYSTDGSNWFCHKTGLNWKPDEKTDMGIEGLDDGVYSLEYIDKQVEKYRNGEESIIIASQHFEIGNEDLRMDITDEVNDILSGKRLNYGFGLAFSPRIEKIKSENMMYAGFFSPRTNTAFQPYVESSDLYPIIDNRYNFCINKENNIYLVCEDDGFPIDLDENPVCKINDIEFEVSRVKKGVYSAHIPAFSFDVEDYTNLYDNWSNMALNGAEIEPVEMVITVQPIKSRLSIGGYSDTMYKSYVPMVSGINKGEKMSAGERHRIFVDVVEKYDAGKFVNNGNLSYKISRKEYGSLTTVFERTQFDLIDGRYTTEIFSDDFVPGDYIIAIFMEVGNNLVGNYGIAGFTVINDRKDAYL